MPFNLLMFINAAVGGIFGALFLIGPERSLAVYELDADPASALLVRLLGAIFLGSAVTAYFTRLAEPSTARRAIVYGYLTASTLALILMAYAMFSDLLGGSGWLAVVTFGLLALLHGQVAWRERLA
jgi:NhaP-type Na+/H+ and K+/H+ antiporter